MKNPERLIVPADAADIRDQKLEKRSTLAFFLIFGGAFFTAAITVAWPFQKINSLYWMIFSVLTLFGLVFVILFLYQMHSVMQNLSDPRTVLFLGVITGKEIREAGDKTDYFVKMGEKEFDVHNELYQGVKIGDRLGVREWLKSGNYIEHTLNPRRIAALEARATHRA